MTSTKLTTARNFSRAMDTQFNFLGFSFGYDSLLGLVPGLGDVVTMFLSLYLIWIAIEMKLPREKIQLMLRNILIDTVIGSIPIIGDIGDLFFKANVRNLKILESATEGYVVE